MNPGGSQTISFPPCASPSLGRQPWMGHSLPWSRREWGEDGGGAWEDLQGRSAHHAGPSDGLRAREQQRPAHLTGCCTTSAVTGPAAISPSAGPPGACKRGAEKEEKAPPSHLLFLPCSIGFCFFVFFLNPATLWSHPGPPASSHLLTGGCHTTDIFSGDSWPCGTQLKYGNGF